MSRYEIDDFLESWSESLLNAHASACRTTTNLRETTGGPCLLDLDLGCLLYLDPRHTTVQV